MGDIADDLLESFNIKCEFCGIFHDTSDEIKDCGAVGEVCQTQLSKEWFTEID